MSYPVLDVIGDLKLALNQSSTVILQAPPGAGKSTVLPLQLLNEPWLKGQRIIMLEPRRLATRAVAYRMSSLYGDEIGHTIGYRMRFETLTSKKTRIEVVTEGILTRLIQQDNTLEGIGMVIFDEFHERSLHADLALAICRQLQQVLRNDLRILIMSATLDGKKISDRLSGAPTVISKGKSFPVEIFYREKSKDDPFVVSVARAIRKALNEQDGDVLTFLPGVGEINKVKELLEKECSDVTILPLYGELSFKKQEEAILPDPHGKRKVVLSTSIAETSLTIEGITTVVDGGLARVPRYDPRSGLTRLETLQITMDAADQRAGRAGRLGPGVCYRMWSKGTHQFLIPNRQPEILEADLSSLVLELANAGIHDPTELEWVTPPPRGAILQAKQLLEDLGAIHDKKITGKGREMVRLPTHPRVAHMFIEAKNNEQLLSLATDCAAILEERDPLPRESGADIALRIALLRKYRTDREHRSEKTLLERIERSASNWRKIFNVKADNSPTNHFDVGILLAHAYPDRIAQQTEKNSVRYKLAGGKIARISNDDPLINEEFLVAASLDGGNSEGKIFLAAPLNKNDIYQLAHETESIRWDEDTQRIVATLEKKIGPLTLTKKVLPVIPDDKRIEVLCSTIRQNGLKFIGWEDDHRLWQSRVLSLKQWRPDEPWPDVSYEKLLDSLEEWLVPFLTGMNRKSDFKQLNLINVLSTIVPWSLSDKLDLLAPTRIKVPSESWIKVKYFADGGPPVIEVRLQEVFGLQDTPRVNDGHMPVLMHLLSPGFRPVQVTQDLKSFWNNTYPEIRKELRIRYAKHYWPEDPWSAQAVRGVKRRVK